MSKEQLYEKIEAYLAREMSPESREAFEAELAGSVELRRELALHRRLHEELAKTGKARLRRQLEQMAAEFPVQSGGKGSHKGRWFMGLALAVVLAVLAWWWFSRQGGRQEAPAMAPAGQMDSLSPQPAPAVRDTAAPPPAEGKPEAAPQQAVADAFAPNARLEALMAMSSTDKPFAISAEAGAAPQPGGRYELVVSGLLRTAEMPAGARFLLRLYDNSPGSFPGGKAVEEGVLELGRVEEDEEIYAFGKLQHFTFRYTLKKRLRPGLYYFLIFSGEGQAPLFAGKTTVGKAGE